MDLSRSPGHSGKKGRRHAYIASIMAGVLAVWRSQFHFHGNFQQGNERRTGLCVLRLFDRSGENEIDAGAVHAFGMFERWPVQLKSSIYRSSFFPVPVHDGHLYADLAQYETVSTEKAKLSQKRVNHGKENYTSFLCRTIRRFTEKRMSEKYQAKIHRMEKARSRLSDADLIVICEFGIRGQIRIPKKRSLSIPCPEIAPLRTSA